MYNTVIQYIIHNFIHNTLFKGIVWFIIIPWKSGIFFPYCPGEAQSFLTNLIPFSHHSFEVLFILQCDLGSILRLGRSPGEGNGYILEYSCLENSMDRGAWWDTFHGVMKSQTLQSD